MFHQSSVKKNRSITVISVIVIVLLNITVILQYNYIRELKIKVFNTTLSKRNESALSAEHKLTGIKTTDQSLKSSVSLDSISDKEKIKKLESQIADMQVWQDHLEKILEDINTKDDEQYKSIVDSKRVLISTNIKPYFKYNNLSSDTQNKITDILLEESLEIYGLLDENISWKEMIQEQEEIEARYDKQIYHLLSADEYNAYKEYKSFANEWQTLNEIQAGPGDMNLGEHQEKQLVAAMHKNWQDMTGMQTNDSVKDYKTLYSMYLDSAKDILSESQLDTFKKYLNNKTYINERNASFEVNYLQVISERDNYEK